MGEIVKQPFGATGHMSSRAIFGSFCLFQATPEETDRTLDLLFEYGVNHIDTAPRYGEAQANIGRWMKNHRKSFFLATKTDQRTYEGAKEQFHRSLDLLQVDSVDLLQLHNLTDAVEREIITGPGGALEFLLEAKESGLTRFLGITGHGSLAPRMHRQSLDRSDFNSVLMPCNYLLMQNPGYAQTFQDLVSYCKERNIAVQTIKSIAAGYWGSKEHTHITWYEPLSDDDAITKCVHWVLGIPYIFLITTGDLKELPKVLSAVSSFENRPEAPVMDSVVGEHNIEPIFP